MKKFFSFFSIAVLSAALTSILVAQESAPSPQDSNDPNQITDSETEAEARKLLQGMQIPMELPKFRELKKDELDAALKLPENPTADALMNFIDEIDLIRPAGLDPESPTYDSEMKTFLTKLANAKLDAAEKVLGMKTADEKILSQAADHKIQTILFLARFVDEKKLEDLRQMPEQLKSIKLDAKSWEIRGIVMQLDLGKEAEKIGKVPTPEFYDATVNKFLVYFEEGIKNNWVTIENAGITPQLVMASESILSAEASIKIFQKFGDMIKSCKDTELASFSKEVENIITRLEKVGKPFSYKFTDIKGNVIDTATLKGKVILIAFWGVKSEDSMRSLQLLQYVYQAYHEKGLEIIAVTMDPATPEFTEMVKKAPFPWSTVFNDPSDPKKEKDKNQKTEKTIAEELGVMMLPMMYLITPEGTFYSTNCSDEKLLEYLEKQYGPIPEMNTPEAENAPEENAEETPKETAEDNPEKTADNTATAEPKKADVQ